MRRNILLLVIMVFYLVFMLVSFGCSNKDKRSYSYNYSYEKYGYENKKISRDDAISDYWDEIKEYINGTETIEAYSYESSNYYDLEVDISNGQIETLYFNNGGHLEFSAEIDNDGHASDTDEDGNCWDFEIDMDSSLIDDAIENWANDNSYEIE